jgi:hypothetical protein
VHYSAFWRVAEDRLSNEKIKFPVQNAKGKVPIEREPGLFDFHHILANFVSDTIVHQPFLGFDTEIVARKKIRNQKPARSQRSTPYIQERVMLPQAKGRQKIELHCGDEVVLFDWTYKRSIVMRASRDCVCFGTFESEEHLQISFDNATIILDLSERTLTFYQNKSA